MTVLEATVLAFVIGCALATAFLRDILAVIVASAAYSLGISILWVLLQAPDVALTEAAVGAGVMTLLFLLTVAKTVNPSTDSRFESVRPRTFVVLACFLGTVLLTVPALPTIGDPAAPVVGGEVTTYYLDNAYDQTGVENAVTAVLAAYRGFDTLGEAAVVFTAGVAVLLVLRREAFV
jgi:multicomponent Na+:H+ antiporter subunit B